MVNLEMFGSFHISGGGRKASKVRRSIDAIGENMITLRFRA